MKYVYFVEFVDGSMKRLESATRQNVYSMLNQSIIKIKNEPDNESIYCKTDHVLRIREKILE